jgi:hypothetical protein
MIFLILRGSQTCFVMVCRYQIVDLIQYRDGREHDIWLPLGAVDTGKIHLLITVVERQADSQSSEDVPNTNSTILEVQLLLSIFAHSSPAVSPQLSRDFIESPSLRFNFQASPNVQRCRIVLQPVILYVPNMRLTFVVKLGKV